VSTGDEFGPLGGHNPARRHPDVFTAAEAAAYLRLPNVRAFNRRRREHGVRGVRSGGSWLYSRATLDALKRLMFGEQGRPRQRRCA
jgi:hypothetical protein